MGGDKMELEVLITSDPAKLPSEVAALLDPSVPLPAETAFFEKRYELAEMMHRLLFAIGISLAAAVIIPFGIAFLFSYPQVTTTTSVDYLPLGFGLVCALAAWMMLASIRTCWNLRRLQSLGQPTRRGTFLTPAALIQAGEIDTTVIPRSRFRGLVGKTVKYHQRDAEKSYRLPAALLNATPQQLEQAITQWAARNTA